MSNFVKNQIVCLEGKNKSLFCEVIDTIDDRCLCWVRPVILVDYKNQTSDFYHNNKQDIHDLRFTSDLLWKIDDFRVVFDTEYLDFFVTLQDFEFEETQLTLANKKLRTFIKELCEKNKSASTN